MPVCVSSKCLDELEEKLYMCSNSIRDNGGLTGKDLKELMAIVRELERCRKKLKQIKTWDIKGLRKVIMEEVGLLRRWAVESKTGGWSTNLVDPMRRRADHLEEILA
jgi:hypothetical protein